MLEAAERYPRIAFEQARAGRTSCRTSPPSPGAHEQSGLPRRYGRRLADRFRNAGLRAAGSGTRDHPHPQWVHPRCSRAAAPCKRGGRRDRNLVGSGAERAVGAQLVEAGADVLATGCTSPGSARSPPSSRSRGAAQDADRLAHFGDVWVSAPCASWSSYACRRVGEFLEGRWASEGHSRARSPTASATLLPWATVVEFGHVSAGDEGQVPPGLTARSRCSPVPSGTWRGVCAFAKGEVPSVSDLLTMDWLVEGVRVDGLFRPGATGDPAERAQVGEPPPDLVSILPGRGVDPGHVPTPAVRVAILPMWTRRETRPDIARMLGGSWGILQSRRLPCYLRLDDHGGAGRRAGVTCRISSSPCSGVVPFPARRSSGVSGRSRWRVRRPPRAHFPRERFPSQRRQRHVHRPAHTARDPRRCRLDPGGTADRHARRLPHADRVVTARRSWPGRSRCSDGI